MRRQTAVNAAWATLLAGIVSISLLWPLYAQEASRIVIDNVDSSAFPTVVIDLAVADELGVPLPELTAADFQIFEDGRKVAASSIALEPDESRPIGIVFAVDLSTEPGDLAEIKSGLRILVERMRAGDQGVLLTFADSVQVAQPMTSNRDELLAAIDALAVEGNYTALNRVTVESINRAELLTVDRRAVVIVTDSVENIASLPVSDVYSRADQMDVPIYLFAFSPKSQPASAMEEYGLRIKGKPFVTDTATATRLRLLTLASLFERGYRLRYISGLPADSNEHTISINLVGRGTVGSSQVEPIFARIVLVALPGQVDVALPGLSDGQTVAGVVELLPTLRAPGPIRQVEYLIDGQVVSTAQAEPFGYTWDTGGLVEGSHVVGLRVADSAGNRGEKYVTVQVVDPLVVQATLTRSKIYVGDEVFVTVDVNALAGVGAVDLLVDGVPLDRRTEPPFLFQFDSSSYAQGEHIITIQASDRTGYLESTKFAMQLLPLPPRFIFTGQTWLRIFAVLAIFLSFVLAWLLLSYLAGLARRRRRRRFSLALDNLGNLASSYLLRADDAKGALRFFLLHKGMTLRGRTVRDWVPMSQEEWENLQFRAQTIRTEQAEAAYLAQSPVPASEAVGGASLTGGLGAAKENVGAGLGRMKEGAGAGMAKLKNIGQSTETAANFTGAGASLLYALGGFLPASLGGAALRRAAQGSMSAYRSVRNVERVQRNVGQLQNASSSSGVPLTAAQQRDMERAKAAGFGTANMEEILAKSSKTAAPQPAPEAASVPAGVKVPAQATGTGLALPGQFTSPSGSNGHGRSFRQTAAGALPPGMDDVRFDAAGVPFKRVTRKIDDVWIETPVVEPGDSLFLELVIEPTNPRRKARVPFRIASKSIEAEEKPLVIQEATVEMRGQSWLSWLLLPLLIVAGSAAVILFMLAFLLTDLGLENWLTGLIG